MLRTFSLRSGWTGDVMPSQPPARQGECEMRVAWMMAAAAACVVSAPASGATYDYTFQISPIVNGGPLISLPQSLTLQTGDTISLTFSFGKSRTFLRSPVALGVLLSATDRRSSDRVVLGDATYELIDYVGLSKSAGVAGFRDFALDSQIGVGSLAPYYAPSASFSGFKVTGTVTRSDFSRTYDRLFVSISDPVPEPATWALMILGFGAIGGAMRRRPTRRAQPV